jgi:hypothetical protein
MRLLSGSILLCLSACANGMRTSNKRSSLHQGRGQLMRVPAAAAAAAVAARCQQVVPWG